MKTVFTISMALLFLLGNIGMSISTHYCGGKISEQSLWFGQLDLSCGMETESENGCDNAEVLVKSKCCSDGHQSFKISDEFKLQKKSNQLEPTLAFVLLTFIVDDASFDSKANFQILNYKPPRPDTDIPVLIQSFLI